MHIAEIETRLSVRVSSEGNLVKAESNDFVPLIPVFERPLDKDEETGDQSTRDLDRVVKSDRKRASWSMFNKGSVDVSWIVGVKMDKSIRNFIPFSPAYAMATTSSINYD